MTADGHPSSAIINWVTSYAHGTSSRSGSLISGAGLRARGASLRNGHGSPFHWNPHRHLPGLGPWSERPTDLAMLAACLAIAALSWRFIERPILAMKDRIGYRFPPS